MPRYRKVQGMTERFNEAVLKSGKSPKEICRQTGIWESSFYEHMAGAAMGELFIAKYCTVLNISADWLLGIKKG